MFVSILLGRFGPRLLPAVVIGFILFFLLTWYCYRSRHKRAKLRLEPKLSNDLYVESLSELPVVEETTADPGSNEIEEEDLVTSYCNNGCQGACACPRIDLNRNVTLSEPTLSTPLQDEALDYHFAGVTRPDSESNLRQRRLIQHLKERFAKNFGIDLDHDSHRSRRILGIPVFPVFSRKTSVCDKDSNDKEKGSNKSASHKEINLRCTMKKAIKGGLLKKAGANKKGENSSQASNDSSNFGSSAEVRKEGSQAKVNERERESVSDNGDDSNEQKKRDSLRLLKGMSSFKKTSSLDGENQSLDSINQVVEK